MSDFQLFFYGLFGIGNKFWFALIYIIATLIFLWRWELEQERIKKASKRKNARRIYLDEFIDRRY